MGVLAIWSIRGRDLVPHLTATSSSARGFQLLVEIFRLWELYQNQFPQHADRYAHFFLLVEQAFGRTIGSETWELPGRRRIAAREHFNNPCISIKDPKWHLLGVQFDNGTLGTYLGAALRAGLLENQPIRLSIETYKQAQENTEFSDSAIRQLFPLVHQAMNEETVKIPIDGRNALLRAITNTYNNIPLANYLYQKIVESHELCHQLVERLRSTEELDRRTVLTHAARDLTDYRETIENVLRCENFLSVVESIFYWLCASKGKSVEEAVPEFPVDLKQLRTAQQDFAHSGSYGTGRGAARATLFRDTIDTSNHIKLARSVLDVHEKVCQSRGRSTWVWESDTGVLSCDENFDLPAKEKFEVGVFWRNDYYLWSLKRVAEELEEARA